MIARRESTRSRDTDIRITRLAARQHGAVSRKPLLAMGLPAHQIDYRLRRGRLTTLHRGVYVVGPVPGRYQRVRGRPRLVRLITADSEPAFTRSEAEWRVLELIRRSGLSPPRVNPIAEGYEVDFLWPTEQLVVEVDGRAFHSGDRSFEKDRSRDADLTASGYAIMRVTWRQIENEPRLLTDRIKRALERRRPSPPRR